MGIEPANVEKTASLSLKAFRYGAVNDT